MERERGMKMADIDSRLARMCIEAATDTRYAVDKWRMQRRCLQRLPSPLASALLRRLLLRRLLFPSLLEVFKFSVEEVDLSGENSVDAEWMAYLGAFSYLRSLNVADCYRINNPALWPLAGMTSLTQLDLSRCMKVTDSGIKHLLSLSQLEKLHLSQTGVTADGVKLLSTLRNLSTLDLGGLSISNSALNSLKELTNLEYLDIWGSEISDEGAAALKNFRKLSFLNIAWTNITKFPNLQSIKCLNMSDGTILSALEDSSGRVTLKKLIAHGSSFPEAEKVFSTIEASCLSFLNLSNTSLSYFGFLHSMDALEHLDLSSSAIQDDVVEAISCIGANLRYLNLNNTKVSSDGLETLAGQVPNLEVLSLSHTLIDDFSIAYISTMPSLKTLDLSNTYIKGSTHQNNNEEGVFTLAALLDLPHLESLDLEKTRVNDAAVHVLLGSQKLSHLSLNSTHLTGKSLEYLSQIKKLASLCIQETLLTNGALDSFDPPVTLEVLDLRGCWLLTFDSLTSFGDKHPGIRVIHDHLDQLNSASVNHNFSSPAALSQKSLKASKSKQRDGKSSVSPSLFKKEALDQRIKYSREEMITLQHLSPPLDPPLNIDIATPDID